jgi:hypothetical protein
LGANSASRASRNTRSLAIIVRSTRARCSYSGIELGPPDSHSRLKRSSALSLEVMEISFAFILRSAVPPDVWANTDLTRIVPKMRRCSRSSQAEVCRALCSFRHLWFDAPDLKAMSADRRFDCIAGKIVRRCALGSDRTNLPPGTKLIRQLAARRPLRRTLANPNRCLHLIRR